MSVVESKEGDVLVLVLEGRITFGHGDTEAGSAIRRALAAGERKILVDMGGVPMVDSAGLGEIVSAYAWAHRSHAAMKLSGLSERVRELLRMTRLGGVFDVFDDRSAAIASFG